MTLPLQVTSEYTKKNLLEMQKTLHRRTARMCLILSLCGLALALLGIALAVGIMIYIGLFWCILFLGMRHHPARKNARNTVKSNQKNYGCNVQTTLKFYNTMFTAKNETTGSELREQYDEVREVLRTGALIVLLLEDRVALMADCTAMEAEDALALWDLLRENCRNAEIFEK